MDCDILKELDAPVISAMQPTEVYFPPYGEEEVRGILHDRVRQGVYPGVISDSIFDLVVEKTMQCGDLRGGVDLVKRAVQDTETDGRTVVGGKDVLSAFEVSQNFHLIATVKVLSRDEKRMLRRMAEYALQEEVMSSGAVFASVREEVPMGYTLYFERLKKFDRMRLINLYSPKIRGNTREITLRFDAGKVVEECGG